MTGKPFETPHGWAQYILPFFQWRRPDGRASFFTDRLGLRKSLSLCASCERYMLPRKWLDRYNYQLVRNVHGEGMGCDYCRADTTTNVYIPMEGTLAHEVNVMEPSVKATKERERRAMMQDNRSIIV